MSEGGHFGSLQAALPKGRQDNPPPKTFHQLALWQRRHVTAMCRRVTFLMLSIAYSYSNFGSTQIQHAYNCILILILQLHTHTACLQLHTHTHTSAPHTYIKRGYQWNCMLLLVNFQLSLPRMSQPKSVQALNFAASENHTRSSLLL